MFPPLQDLYRVAPELVLCAFGMLVMFLAPIVPKARHGALSTISLLGAALALAATRFLALYPGAAYSGLVRADSFSLFVHLIVIGVAFLAILGSIGYLKREDLDAGEFCALILFATAGMGVMAGAHELLTAFIGLEMSSIASYILASYRRDAPRSNEAAMKYFLLGSFATAFFLYGIALSFGATGSTHLDMMTPLANDSSHVLLKIGLGFIFVGLAFKVAAAPFQLWTPDVYEGAPAPVTALLSTGPKAAAFALALRILASIGAAASLWFWGALGCGRAQHVCGQSLRNRADEREAHAGLQLDRARGIHPGRSCRRGRHRSSRSRNRRRSVLPGELRPGEAGRIPDRRATRRRWRTPRADR